MPESVEHSVDVVDVEIHSRTKRAITCEGGQMDVMAVERQASVPRSTGASRVVKLRDESELRAVEVDGRPPLLSLLAQIEEQGQPRGYADQNGGNDR